MKEKAKKRIKRVIVALVVLGLIYGLALGYGWGRLLYAYHVLNHAGRPTSLDAIIPAPVADFDNAALLYTSAIARLKAEPVEGESLSDYLQSLFRQDPNEAVLQTIDQWLDSDLLKDVLDLIKQGTDRPACRFDLDYNDGFDIQMTYLKELKLMIQLMARQVERYASLGDYDQAWEQIRTMGKLAEAVRDEPFIVNQLVRTTQIKFTLNSIQSLAPHASPSQEQVTHILTLIEPFDSKDPLIKAIDGERLIFGRYFFDAHDFDRTYLTLGLTAPLERISMAMYLKLGKPVLLADQAYYLETMNKMSRYFQTPYYETTQADKDITENCPKIFFMTRMILPAFWRVHVLHACMLAKLHITRIGLLLIDQYQETSSWPDTLKALPQKDVIDPFTGAPLVYRREANGFLLYSLGINGKDDYGQVDLKDRDKGDIAWHYVQTP